VPHHIEGVMERFCGVVIGPAKLRDASELMPVQGRARRSSANQEQGKRVPHQLWDLRTVGLRLEVNVWRSMKIFEVLLVTP